MNYGFKTSTTGGQYVYYKRLLGDNSEVNRALGKAAEARIEAIEGARKDFRSGATSQLKSMAQAERQKEYEFLKNVFEVDLQGYEIDKEGSDKEITEAINKVFSLHNNLEAYERARTRLLDKNQSIITPTKVFDEKFTTYWDMYSSDLQAICAKGIRESTDLTTPIRNFVLKVAKSALEEVFDSKTMSNSSEDTAVFQELKDAIGEFQGGGLLDELYKAYNLDKVVEEIETSIRGVGKNERQKTVKRMAAAGIGKTSVKQKNGPSSGRFFESVEAEILTRAATNLNNTRISNGFLSLDINVEHTGGLNAKPDNIMTFGVDLRPLYKALESYESEDRSNRTKNISAFEELNKKLQGTGDGYIVYFNDKDYILGRNFKGFAAGDSQSLANFKSTFGVRVDESLIEGILQTMSGAVGENIKGTLSEALASDIAMWLFDDFDTIGAMPEQSTPSSLHIMSLDGMYVPLSVFLNKLAGAFAEVEGDVNKLVRVDIDSGSIAYPKGDIVPGRGMVWGMEKWESQAAIAQTQIKIGVHFLNSFKQFMSGLG